MDEIDEKLESFLIGFTKENNNMETWSDPTGESTFTDIYYESGDGTVTITCYDFQRNKKKDQ